MKIHNIILAGLLLPISLFAAEEKALCKFQMKCQLYKLMAERYNAEFGLTEVFIPLQDEVTHEGLKNELRNLAAEISFENQDGQLIVPEINVKTGRTFLPMTKSAEYLVAQYILVRHDNPLNRKKAAVRVDANPGSLGLIEDFNAMKPILIKNNLFVCNECSETEYEIHRKKININ